MSLAYAVEAEGELDRLLRKMRRLEARRACEMGGYGRVRCGETRAAIPGHAEMVMAGEDHREH